MARFAPMLATTDRLPHDDGSWVFEGKWDGVRALVYCDQMSTTLRSRRDLDFTASWPELAGLGAAFPPDTVLDGEIVTLGPDGAPSFGLLQSRMNVARPPERLVAEVPVLLMAFDLLRLDGHDVTTQPWSARRSLLESLELPAGRALVPPAFPGPGDAVLAACVAQGLEGVVAKRTGSPYLPGQRSRDWIKVKPVRRQEVVIGGYELGDGGRAGRLGSLLLGTYDGEQLLFCGKVGTGFTQRTLDEVLALLKPLEIGQSPYAAGVPALIAKAAHWVRPELVCEVEFMAWTADGRMRHPSYKGMRSDKAPSEVVREPDGA